jgi:hypothetical protein
MITADGRVMRSFEPGLCFMRPEDAREHREIFGEEGACVLFADAGNANRLQEILSLGLQ